MSKIEGFLQLFQKQSRVLSILKILLVLNGKPCIKNTNWILGSSKLKSTETNFCTHNLLTRKGTQMINSDLIQTLVIDRLIIKIKNREKIIGGDLLWRSTEAAKNPIFERF